MSSLALLASVRNIVIPLSRSRNYFFIDKMRCSHFSGLPDCHCKQVSLKCISEKVDPIYRGTRSDFLEQWRSYVLHLFIIFNRWLFVWGKQMCYRTLLLSRITSSYITMFAQFWQRTQFMPVLHLFICCIQTLRIFWLSGKEEK